MTHHSPRECPLLRSHTRSCGIPLRRPRPALRSAHSQASRRRRIVPLTASTNTRLRARYRRRCARYVMRVQPSERPWATHRRPTPPHPCALLRVVDRAAQHRPRPHTFGGCHPAAGVPSRPSMVCARPSVPPLSTWPPPPLPREDCAHRPLTSCPCGARPPLGLHQRWPRPHRHRPLRQRPPVLPLPRPHLRSRRLHRSPVTISRATCLTALRLRLRLTC